MKSPSTEAYLSAIPEIINQATSEGNPNYELRSIIDAELAQRYPNLTEARFESLYAAYRAIFNDWLRSGERQQWTGWLILSWVHTNAINLDEVDHFAFEGYKIQVTQRDFNADGQHEWLLTIQPDGNLIVVRRDAGGKYQIVDTPLPFF